MARERAQHVERDIVVPFLKCRCCVEAVELVVNFLSPSPCFPRYIELINSNGKGLVPDQADPKEFCKNPTHSLTHWHWTVLLAMRRMSLLHYVVHGLYRFALKNHGDIL